MFEINQLVNLAKRENNEKRSYLYVNPLQGKHIPVNPRKTKEMCKLLADEVKKSCSNEKLFVIGFAETATAIASYVASYLDNAMYFENTTREEEMKESEYLYFTESHSHATEQKLNAKWFDDYLFMVDRIVFVEDEVTTGNTIYKLITEIKTRFPKKTIKFSIASVLNSMIDDRIQELSKQDIDCIYLKKIPFEYRKDVIDTYEEKDECMLNCIDASYNKLPKIHQVTGGIDPRVTCKVDDYLMRVNHFCAYVYENEFRNKVVDEVLIIGTEEFMYPAIELAGYLQEQGVCKEIKTHSTTRSPIMAYDVEDYPLHNRYTLISVYDDERVTYIYNLKKYDEVVVVTDSKLVSHKGLESLLSALQKVGNNNISVYQWSV